jgi:hypothetical protein
MAHLLSARAAGVTSSKDIVQLFFRESDGSHDVSATSARAPTSVLLCPLIAFGNSCIDQCDAVATDTIANFLVAESAFGRFKIFDVA